MACKPKRPTRSKDGAGLLPLPYPLPPHRHGYPNSHHHHHLHHHSLQPPLLPDPLMAFDSNTNSRTSQLPRRFYPPPYHETPHTHHLILHHQPPPAPHHHLYPSPHSLDLPPPNHHPAPGFYRDLVGPADGVLHSSDPYLISIDEFGAPFNHHQLLLQVHNNIVDRYPQIQHSDTNHALQMTALPHSPSLRPAHHDAADSAAAGTTSSSTLDLLVLRQVEYYFSIDNLCKDLYLRSHMDSEGFVLVSLIASFNRIRRLGASTGFVRRVLQMHSLVVEVRGYRVRRRGDGDKWVLDWDQAKAFADLLHSQKPELIIHRHCDQPPPSSSSSSSSSGVGTDIDDPLQPPALVQPSSDCRASESPSQESGDEYSGSAVHPRLGSSQGQGKSSPIIVVDSTLSHELITDNNDTTINAMHHVDPIENNIIDGGEPTLYGEIREDDGDIGSELRLIGGDDIIGDELVLAGSVTIDSTVGDSGMISESSATPPCASGDMEPPTNLEDPHEKERAMASLDGDGDIEDEDIGDEDEDEDIFCDSLCYIVVDDEHSVDGSSLSHADDHNDTPLYHDADDNEDALLLYHDAYDHEDGLSLEDSDLPNVADHETYESAQLHVAHNKEERSDLVSFVMYYLFRVLVDA